ncbi:YopT-type cysteine protease domain-containing protein [Pelagibaculum spongiae]|nr:YopT-type cysteine protease domain-containing protein [Pelagibaculum spongiae]
MNKNQVHYLEEKCKQAKVIWHHRYSQADDQRALDFELTVNGWCLGMVLHWLGYQAYGRKDFWRLVDSPDGVRKFRQVMAAQQLATRMGLGVYDKLTSRYNMLLQQYNLQLTAASDLEPTISGFSILQHAGVYQGSKAILGLYGPKGGHAIGLNMRSTELRIFDPNYGEFWFPGYKNASKWLDRYLQKMYNKFHFNQHTIEKFDFFNKNAT